MWQFTCVAFCFNFGPDSFIVFSPFRTNLWVAESFAVQSQTVKGVRRHARGRMGEITYRYVNYYVRLEEGAPPPVYREEDTLNEIDPRRSLEEYIRGHRAKHVPYHTEKDPNYY